MYNQYLIILPLSYIGLFLLFTLIVTIFPKSKIIVFCTTCSAFFSLLLIGFILKFPAIILIFMLGMSITGISVKLSEYLKSKGKNYIMQFFLLQLLMAMIGLLIVIFYLAKFI